MQGSRYRPHKQGVITTRTQTVVSALAVVATITVAACAGAAGGGGIEVDVGAGGALDPSAYQCLGRQIPQTALTDPTTADRLGPDGLAALAEAEARPEEGIDLGDLTTWWVASESETSIVLLRPLSVPEDLGAGDVRTHEVAAVEVVDATNVQGWMVTQLGTCALARPEAGTATVTLDPEHPPTPGATTLALLVTETACNSGEDATGRIRLLALRETATTVEVSVGVTARGGAHTCPSNPPTPFIVQLDGPLGSRAVLDDSVHPPRPITAP